MSLCKYTGYDGWLLGTALIDDDMLPYGPIDKKKKNTKSFNTHEHQIITADKS